MNQLSPSGLSTEVYFFGTQLTTTLVGALLGLGLVHSLLLPVLHPLGITSINEVLTAEEGDWSISIITHIC